MKRIAIILALVLIVPLAMFSQDKEMAKLFKHYKNVQGFELQDVDPDIDFDNDDEFNIGSFLDKVEKIYILSFDNTTGNKADLNTFSNKLDKLLDKKNFESMLDVGGDSKVAILMRKGKDDKISDFFLTAIGDEDATFVWAVAP
jgi:hypothetical protein